MTDASGLDKQLTSKEALDASATQLAERLNNLLDRIEKLPTAGERATIVAWREHAACRGTFSSVFFPDKGKQSSLKEARKWCDVCPVATECLAYANDMRIAEGIWGGKARSGQNVGYKNID